VFVASFDLVDRSRLVRWLREHPRAADALLAAAVTAVSLVAHLVGTGMGEAFEIRDPAWWTVPLVMAATAPIAWRRTAPVASAFVVVAAQAAMEVLRLEGSGWLGVVVAIYSVGAHGVDRRRTLGAAGLFGLIGLLLVSGVVVRQIGLGVLVGTSAVVVSAYLFGDNVRRRRLHLESLAERAERAEREQELITRSRVRDERTRLARELHDVVAHSVSVMIIQSGAARRSLPDRPHDATAMLHEVELSGRRAMDELRRVLGVLRGETDHEPVTLDPQPGLDDLQTLIDHDPDLPVTLLVDESVCSLPEGVAVSAYRLVQESLTNVRRHAGDVRSVEVRLRRCDDILEVEVTDDGRGAATTAAAGATDADGVVHPGFGLAGMHERATALGGSVTAGPRRGGGWRVHAELPVGTSP
jgi:signal transduction histidine kinase